MKLRYSAFAEWQNCRRKYDLQYVQGWRKPETVPSKAEIGTLVHAGLKAYYLNEDHKLGVLNAVPALHCIDGKELTDAVSLAQIMVEGYIQWQEEEGLDCGWEVLLTEKQLEYKITPGVILTGQVDLVVRDGVGQTWLVDHKTCQSFSQYTTMLSMNQQLMWYTLLLKANGIDVDGAQFNMLRRVKRGPRATPPFYAREEVRFSGRQLDKFKSRVLNQIEEMQQSAVPPRPTQDCSWRCPFVNVCPEFDNGGYAEEMLQDQFIKEGNA